VSAAGTRGLLDGAVPTLGEKDLRARHSAYLALQVPQDAEAIDVGELGDDGKVQTRRRPAEWLAVNRTSGEVRHISPNPPSAQHPQRQIHSTQQRQRHIERGLVSAGADGHQVGRSSYQKH
jgi:hypothetical protein